MRLARRAVILGMMSWPSLFKSRVREKSSKRRPALKPGLPESGPACPKAWGVRATRTTEMRAQHRIGRYFIGPSLSGLLGAGLADLGQSFLGLLGEFALREIGDKLGEVGDALLGLFPFIVGIRQIVIDLVHFRVAWVARQDFRQPLRRRFVGVDPVVVLADDKGMRGQTFLALGELLLSKLGLFSQRGTGNYLLEFEQGLGGFGLIAARLEGLLEEGHGDPVLRIGGRRAVGGEVNGPPVFGGGQHHAALIALVEIGIGDRQLAPLA